jgi:syntaxin-binding protein 5
VTVYDKIIIQFSVTLQVLYKLKTAKIFEKPKKESQDDDPFAVYLIYLCPESRTLCVATLP